jgi:hypothetical protein
MKEDTFRCSVCHAPLTYDETVFVLLDGTRTYDGLPYCKQHAPPPKSD